MDRQRNAATEAFTHAAMDYFFRQPEARGRGQSPGPQQVPVNVYETEEDVIVVAPMPGVEAENIDIEVLGSTVSLRASLRGPGQEDRRYLVHEWSYGPYERQITLPVEVDAGHANASHSNGVLVLSLPKAARTRAVRVPLGKAAASGSAHRGHSGHHTSRQGLEGAD